MPVFIMKGLGLYRNFVVEIKIYLKVGLAKYWHLEYKQTKKQSEQITTQGFINLQFLQKLSSQKPFWDKVRLSNLVYNRLAYYGSLLWLSGSYDS